MALFYAPFEDLSFHRGFPGGLGQGSGRGIRILVARGDPRKCLWKWLFFRHSHPHGKVALWMLTQIEISQLNSRYEQILNPGGSDDGAVRSTRTARTANCRTLIARLR